jgi:hypothetical protein
MHMFEVNTELAEVLQAGFLSLMTVCGKKNA